MIYSVIDPYLLYFNDQQGLQPIDENTLAELVSTIYRADAFIPLDAFYWPMLVTDFLTPLVRRMCSNSSYKNHLRALERRLIHVELPLLPNTVHVSGPQHMFQHLGNDWLDVMQAIIAGCTLLGDTILLTRLISGRNSRPSTHKDYTNTFIEKTCWELRIEMLGSSIKQVPCICSQRNFDIRWTCRYSDALPACEDGGKCPFYPKSDWCDPSTDVAVVHKSRPTWVDSLGLHWAEPAAQQANNTSYHWDVYLDKNIQIMEVMLGKKFKTEKKDPYVNIAKWRPNASSDDQGTPGDIHHPPAAKKKPGWRR